jgi:uncharacterized iron-regulated membrane protein
MKLRRILFWVHLCIGVAAGAVILVMAATGVILAYEKQVVAFASREYRVAPPPGQTVLPLGDLLAKISDAEGKPPSGITLRAEPGAATEVSFGRDRTEFVNPYTGEVMGESRKLPAFFSTVENIHRWLGTGEAGRPWGKGITGACTLAFVGLTLSGPFIWWPKEWTRANLRKIALFRGGLRGRALFWNWHNVLGIWCVAPLFVIALTGVVMSYGWANNLLYRLTGNQPPVANVGTAPRSQDRPGNRPGGDHSRREDRNPEPASAKFGELELLVARAQHQVPQWRSMQIRLPNGRGPLSVFVDEGSGRPDLRSQFSLNAQTGEIRWEQFSSYNAGRRLRTWARFTHTGEAGGLLGQTVAALACASAVVLVATGLLLSLKRLLA